MDERIEYLHRGILSKALEVTEIFNDFYGEDRVELQGGMTLEGFKQRLYTTPMIWIVGSLGGFKLSRYYINQPDSDRVYSSYLGEYEHRLTDSDEIFDKYAPYLVEFINDKWFKDLNIITHFPKVTITNEYDESVQAENLWIKTPITPEGKGKGWFKMNRSTYEVSHMEADYMHSHVAGIPFSDFTEFQSVCTGTGPINSTLASLATSFDGAIWQLYCLELERYVATESISGVPYRRLNRIGGDNNNTRRSFKIHNNPYADASIFSDSMKGEFLRYILESNKLKFNYIKGSYGLATSFVDTVIIISNLFIEWYNKRCRKDTEPIFTMYRLRNSSIIKEVIIHNNTIYGPNNTNRDYSEYIGKHVLNFKGKDITLEVKGVSNGPRNSFIVLNIDIIEEYVIAILNILNCDYGNSKKTKAGVSQEKTRFDI